jgi:hypothetical protein
MMTALLSWIGTRRNSTIPYRCWENLDRTVWNTIMQEKLDCYGGSCNGSHAGEDAGTKEMVIIACGDEH